MSSVVFPTLVIGVSSAQDRSKSAGRVIVPPADGAAAAAAAGGVGCAVAGRGRRRRGFTCAGRTVSIRHGAGALALRASQNDMATPLAWHGRSPIQARSLPVAREIEVDDVEMPVTIPRQMSVATSAYAVAIVPALTRRRALVAGGATRPAVSGVRTRSRNAWPG